jgi:hydrogenase maturation protease
MRAEAASPAPPRLLLVGLGNALAGDAGAGPAVVARLRAAGLPAGLRAEEGGSDALRLATLWRGEPEVWLADALQRGAPPGTVHRLEHEELLAIPQRHAGAHHLSLPECLRWLALSDPNLGRVRFRLWGIEPGRLAAVGLTPAVEEAAGAVAAEIARCAAPRRAGGG